MLHHKLLVGGCVEDHKNSDTKRAAKAEAPRPEIAWCARGSAGQPAGLLRVRRAVHGQNGFGE